jgi:Concanavalin A-like lectin/glucanases superfamily/Peptide-N-glycosidase F, C terminal/Secretion system C-terminal sorting domain
MKFIYWIIAFFCGISFQLYAQLPGDTLVVQAYNYAQTNRVGNRDTMVAFPNVAGLSFEKIIMLYNMRCKNGVVGSGVTPQAANGCGEWDYSCNTYIVDSTQQDSVKAKGPSHTISGFSGTTFPYTTMPVFTYYKYYQQQVSYTNTISENIGIIGSGNATTNQAIYSQLQNGKTQYLYTASELLGSGISAGNISSIRLFVNNAGSDAQFFKIKMKHTSQTFLDASMPQINGFSEVYFLNTSFVNGINQFAFYNNFNWNGIDNILVEFSFSSANNGSSTTLESDTNTSNLGLVSTASDYYIEFDGNNKLDIGNSNFSSIANQLSICFWANGNATVLPANSSILESMSASNQRQVNIHLPWSNSNIYWDCGNGASIDRISQIATASSFAGNWHHWAFTKNSTTGVMNIYLDGVLWLTGSGKTIPIAITNLAFGGGANNTNPYYGKVDDIALFNTELSQATIQSWMNKSIDNTHPNYTNLVSNYTLNDGSGNTCIDASSNPSSANFVGIPLWKIGKGKDIFKNFVATNNRPKMAFVQGVYTQSTATIVAMDSVLNNFNTVQTFAVNNNNYAPTGTANYYYANQAYIYSGDSMQLIDSVAIANNGVINITALPYMLRSPSRYQIMSFVTPYGNGLDLGVNGKTYSFDVSDYAPILKGNKKMTMDAGGQWQEDMDIKFLFIVGTPPHNVKSITNLWKVESRDYANIVNNNYFEPRTLALDAAGKSFKLRTTISGHGQEGEFIPQTHLLNIDGGTDEFSWQVVKACAENPVYPQGGTWVYDRAGWCPGMATDTKESDITPFVMAGSNAIIDYNVTNASGDSRYWVSNQLVTYDAENFALDAAIVDIKNPSKKIEYARNNAICGQPIVSIKNTGKANITSVVIEYWVNNHTPKETYTWVGNLAFMQTVNVVLPYNDNLWGGVNGASGNVFFAEIKTVNNVVDDYALNNKMKSPFDITGVVPSNFVVWFKTNNVGAENNFEIKDGNGFSIFKRDNMANNTLYKDTFTLGVGCYQLVVNDAGEDGLNWWANPNAGAGTVSIKKINGAGVKSFNADFGKSIIYNFTIDFPLKFEHIFKENEITLSPNPAHNQIVLQGQNIQNASVKIINQLGQCMMVPQQKFANKIILDSSQLPAGLYTATTQMADGDTQRIQILKQ